MSEQKIRGWKGLFLGKEQYYKDFLSWFKVDSLVVQQPLKNSVSWES